MSFLQSQTYRNPESSFFEGGAGGGGIPYPVQTNLPPGAAQTFSSGSQNPKVFDTGVTTAAGGTYSVSVTVQWRTDSNVPSDDVFQMAIFNSSGADPGCIIYQPFLAGASYIYNITPAPLNITMSGIITNTKAENLVVYINCNNAPVGAYYVNLNNVVVQRLI